MKSSLPSVFNREVWACNYCVIPPPPYSGLWTLMNIIEVYSWRLSRPPIAFHIGITPLGTMGPGQNRRHPDAPLFLTCRKSTDPVQGEGSADKLRRHPQLRRRGSTHGAGTRSTEMRDGDPGFNGVLHIGRLATSESRGFLSGFPFHS